MAGDWRVPAGVKPSGGKAEPGVTWHVGTVTVTRELEIEEGAREPIALEIRFQVCNEVLCFPPDGLELEVPLEVVARDRAPTFAAPVKLEAGGKPMGGKRLYPSPVLHDLDGDGRMEMILGDLKGDLTISTAVDGDGPRVWGPAVAMPRAPAS